MPQLSKKVSKANMLPPSDPPYSEGYHYHYSFYEKNGKEQQKNSENIRYVEKLPNGLTLEVLYVPRGIYAMGTPKNEPNRLISEGPVHKVEIKEEFYIGRVKITVAQFWAVIDSRMVVQGDGNMKKVNVSYKDAVKFCQLLTRKTGRTYRLPAENEWEWAARARTATPYNFGFLPTIKKKGGEVGYERIDIRGDTPNAWGIEGMHSDTWEWVKDYWHFNYHSAPVNQGAWTHNRKDNHRVLRGGCLDDRIETSRSGARSSADENKTLPNIGFRVVMEAPELIALETPDKGFAAQEA